MVELDEVIGMDAPENEIDDRKASIEKEKAMGWNLTPWHPRPNPAAGCRRRPNARALCDRRKRHQQRDDERDEEVKNRIWRCRLRGGDASEAQDRGDRAMMK